MRKFFTFLLLSSAFYVNGQDFTFEFYDQDTDAIAVADFDKDGYPDIFGVNFIFGKADLYLLVNKKNTTKPTFDKKNILLSSDFKGRPYAYDADNDGDIDVLYSKGATWDMEIYLNDGKGNFTSKALGVSGSNRFDTKDMDKDGDLDIIGYNSTDKTISLYTNTGNMTYTRQIIFKDNANLRDFTVGDLNGDGLPEVILSLQSGAGEQVVVLENKGNNTLVKKAIISDKYSGITEVVINDLNKDGKNDLIIKDLRSVRLGINNGNFQFTDQTLVSINEGGIYGVSVVDLTGESEKDMIICTSLKTIWLKNINKADFSYEQKEFGTANGIFTFYHADFNKDSTIDFAYSNQGLSFYMNNLPQLPSDLNDIQTNLKVYPNPAKDVVFVDGTDGTDMTAHFYNQVGMLVQEVAVKGGQVDVSSLSSGSYIFTIIDASGKVVGRSKMVKE